MFNIHIEKNEIDAVYSLLEQAFGRSEEANLVKVLRERGMICLSLVALFNESPLTPLGKGGTQVVGYIAFSPVTIGTENPNIKVVGLAPLAVLPAYQRQGIGSKMVEKGLSELASSGYDAVVVLGEPEFYQRFGFQQSTMYGIRYTPDIPEQYFMVLSLRSGALLGKTGVVEYQPEFGQV
jgi:putative acetyltransferase